MPNPDGIIETRDFAGKSIVSNLLANDLQTATFTATTRFTGPYETNVAAAGTARLTLQSGLIRQYTGDADEKAPSAIQTAVSGSGDTRTVQITIHGPSFIDDDTGAVRFTSRSASFDDATFPPGWIFSYAGNSVQTPEVQLQNSVDLVLASGSDLKLSTGSELVIPALTSDPSAPADGNMWVHTVDNALYIWEGGARRTIASW